MRQVPSSGSATDAPYCASEGAGHPDGPQDLGRADGRLIEIIKPAKETQTTYVLIAEALANAGPPADVLMVFLGDQAIISHAMISSPINRKVSFAGATPIGKQFAAPPAHQVTRATGRPLMPNLPRASSQAPPSSAPTFELPHDSKANPAARTRLKKPVVPGPSATRIS